MANISNEKDRFKGSAENVMRCDDDREDDSLNIKPPQLNLKYMREASFSRQKARSFDGKKQSRCSQAYAGDKDKHYFGRENEKNNCDKFINDPTEKYSDIEREKTKDVARSTDKKFQKIYERNLNSDSFPDRTKTCTAHKHKQYSYAKKLHYRQQPYIRGNRDILNHIHYQNKGLMQNFDYSMPSYFSGRSNSDSLDYDLNFEFTRTEQNCNPEQSRSAESLEQDLRSRLLNKRSQHVKKIEQNYDRNADERNSSTYDDEMIIPKSSPNIKENIIEVCDSSDVEDNEMKQRKKLKKKKKIRIIEHSSLYELNDLDLIGKQKLLTAQREKKKRDDIEWQKLSSRRILHKQHTEVIDVLSPSTVAAKVTAGLKVIKKKRYSSHQSRKKCKQSNEHNLHQKSNEFGETDMAESLTDNSNEVASNDRDGYIKDDIDWVDNANDKTGVSDVSSGDENQMITTKSNNSKRSVQYETQNIYNEKEVTEDAMSTHQISQSALSDMSDESGSYSHISHSTQSDNTELSNSTHSSTTHSKTQSENFSFSTLNKENMNCKKSEVYKNDIVNRNCINITKEKSEESMENSENLLLPDYFPGIQGCRSVEEFQCLNRIEEGTYGVVYRAKDKRTNEIVALKRLKMEKEKEGFPITSLREINTLLKGQHPNIVTVREIVVGSNMDKIFIVMDYVEHDLKSLMETMKIRKQSFFPGEVKCLILQLLRAVGHLHDNWILHRDLKTSNLLLSHKGILKVGDFGLAREYGSPLNKYTLRVVTLWYRAPELLLCSPVYSTPIDIWSVGCIFAEFLQMAPLFPGESEIDQLHRIFKELGTPNEKIWPGYNELPAVKNMMHQNSQFVDYPISNTHRKRFNTTDSGISLLNGLLTYDPKQRLSAEAALSHPYFKELPLAIDPSMFPTWPAKSELGSRKVISPKPYLEGGNRDEDTKSSTNKLSTIINENKKSTGFVLNAGLQQQRLALNSGFNLKF